MNECQIRGCRKLEWRCRDCSRSAATCDLADNLWIKVTDKIPPPMETVLLAVGNAVTVGWNEATQEGEDPAYCAWDVWPRGYERGEGVTHWMPLPRGPKD